MKQLSKGLSVARNCYRINKALQGPSILKATSMPTAAVAKN